MLTPCLFYNARYGAPLCVFWIFFSLLCTRRKSNSGRCDHRWACVCERRITRCVVGSCCVTCVCHMDVLAVLIYAVQSAEFERRDHRTSSHRTESVSSLSLPYPRVALVPSCAGKGSSVASGAVASAFVCLLRGWGGQIWSVERDVLLHRASPCLLCNCKDEPSSMESVRIRT